MSILYLGIYARFLLDKKWKDEIINSENVVATNFKGGEFDTFKKDAGTNAYTFSIKEWNENLCDKGIIIKSGIRGGGSLPLRPHFVACYPLA